MTPFPFSSVSSVYAYGLRPDRMASTLMRIAHDEQMRQAVRAPREEREQKFEQAGQTRDLINWTDAIRTASYLMRGR